MNKVLLIVPCFNEADRLKLGLFEKFSDNISFLFANDGSNDSTLKLIERFCEANQNAMVFNSKTNLGKSGILFKAVEFLKEENHLNEYEWFGFWDADLSTPLWEVENMLHYNNLMNLNASSIWASRIMRAGAKIQRRRSRHVAARLFSFVISKLFEIPVYDTQCGAKLFSRDCFECAFQAPFLTNWIFDVEIYLRVRKDFSILEYPVCEWKDIPGGKVNILKDMFPVLRDVVLLLNKFW